MARCISRNPNPTILCPSPFTWNGPTWPYVYLLPKLLHTTINVVVYVCMCMCVCTCLWLFVCVFGCLSPSPIVRDLIFLCLSPCVHVCPFVCVHASPRCGRTNMWTDVGMKRGTCGLAAVAREGGKGENLLSEPRVTP